MAGRRRDAATTFFVSSVVALVLATGGSAHARATFDASTKSLHVASDAQSIKTIDFESADSLRGVELASWDRTTGQFNRVPITATSQIASLLTSGEDDVVEGTHAMRLGEDGEGLFIADAELLASLKSERFEITFWARSDGLQVPLRVVYDEDPNNVLGGPFTNVEAIRSGRETNDGWVEYVAGPLDGAVWGVPVQAILVLPPYDAASSGTFVIDALEIRKLDGAPLAPLACTQQNVDTACGAEGDCLYGQCIPSVFTWGMLPAPAHRAAIAERWIYFGTRLLGDRAAVVRATNELTPRAREIAKTATSSRQFFGGMAQLVSELRDNHTSFGSPLDRGRLGPQLGYGDSNALGACFGVVEKDVDGGGLGYAVFKATDHPATQTPLRAGDIVVAIDGRDPRQWVDEIWPRYSTTLPNDATSDWGASANDLSRLIAMRASTVSFARCTSAASCTGKDRQTFSIDIANAARAEFMGHGPQGTSSGFWCSPRFTNTVEPTFDGNGGDAVYTANDDGHARIQFDGFWTNDAWRDAFSGVFQSQPSTVLVDARIGHGGYFDGIEHIFDLVRGASEPVGVLMLGRGTYDLTDPTWLVSRLGECAGGVTQTNQWACYQGSGNGFFGVAAAPPAANSRIAWLNTMDVSANDFMPRLLKGRSNFKIFAPHATSGAFGAIVPVPAAWPGWSKGNLQIQDSRFAADVASTANARWESGHGVEPDIVVVQKLSDTLDGVDTLVQTANAWLAGL